MNNDQIPNRALYVEGNSTVAMFKAPMTNDQILKGVLYPVGNGLLSGKW